MFVFESLIQLFVQFTVLQVILISVGSMLNLHYWPFSGHGVGFGVRVALRLIRPWWFMPSFGDFALSSFFLLGVRLGADTRSLPFF